MTTNSILSLNFIRKTTTTTAREKEKNEIFAKVLIENIFNYFFYLISLIFTIFNFSHKISFFQN